MQNVDEEIDLTEAGFSFAVQNIDPSIGRLAAWQVNWDGVTGEKTTRSIPLAPCNTLYPNIELTNDYFFARTGSKLEDKEASQNTDAHLCP